jgi:hypothetical protein
MSSLSRFSPDFTAGQQRFHVNNTNTITGYLKCDGSVVSQATYPELYAQIGLIPDGPVLTTWTVGTSPINRPYTATYGNGVFVAAGDASSLVTSTDGVTWTSRNPNFPAGTTDIFGSDFGGGIFVIGTDNGSLATSTDGATWTLRTSGTTSSIEAVAYGNSLYVIAGANGFLRTSTDAITWTARTTGTTKKINAVKYLNSQWVYVGNDSTLATSTDAITWTARTANAFSSNVAATINDIAYGNGAYVYCSSSGMMGYSTDAIRWVTATLASPSTVRSVNYFGNIFVATLNFNSPFADAYVSYDGLTWSSVTSGSSYNIFDSAYSGTRLVAVATNGSSAATFMYADYYTYSSTTNFKLPTTSTGIISANATTPVAYIKVK